MNHVGIFYNGVHSKILNTFRYYRIYKILFSLFIKNYLFHRPLFLTSSCTSLETGLKPVLFIFLSDAKESDSDVTASSSGSSDFSDSESDLDDDDSDSDVTDDDDVAKSGNEDDEAKNEGEEEEDPLITALKKAKEKQERSAPPGTYKQPSQLN